MFFLKSKKPVSPEEVERAKQRELEELERRRREVLRIVTSLYNKLENGTITNEELDKWLRRVEEILMYGKTRKQMRMEVIVGVVWCFGWILNFALICAFLSDPIYCGLNIDRAIANWKESIRVAIAYYPVKLVEQIGMWMVQHQSA